MWFEMDRHQRKVPEVTYYWTDRAGEAHLLHYAVIVEDAGDLYELIFNTLDLSWSLHTPS